MNVQCANTELFNAAYDAVILFTYEDGSDNEERFSTATGKPVTQCRERKEFEGKPKQFLLERRAEMPRFVVLVGLGKKNGVTTSRIRDAYACAAEALREAGATTISFIVPLEPDADGAAQAAVEGAILRTYQFNKYKTQKLDEIKELKSLTIITDDRRTQRGVERAAVIAAIVNDVRDIQNTPSSNKTPQDISAICGAMAKKYKLKCQILDKSKLQKLSYGGILAVGRGSAHEPRLVTLEYTPKGAKHTIALVGKGITFDTGGVNVKPGEHQSGDMKFDMSGAATVLGAISCAAKLNLNVRIVAVLCLAENMMDGNAYKPGDVVVTKSGKTIEIGNTDAEGRVVLADGLTHATLYRPDVIVDVATLTGACVVALGDVCAGALGSEKIIQELKDASDTCGERIWHLPTLEEYAEDIHSSIADMKNIGMKGMAGATAGAMLLKQFVGDTPWVHLDTAGVAWTQGRERHYTKVGGTGFGVRLLTQWLRSMDA